MLTVDHSSGAGGGRGRQDVGGTVKAINIQVRRVHNARPNAAVIVSTIAANSVHAVETLNDVTACVAVATVIDIVATTAVIPCDDSILRVRHS